MLNFHNIIIVFFSVCNWHIARKGRVNFKLVFPRCGCSEQESDYVSRELLEDLLGDEEEQMDWLETQQGLIEKVTIENYLQSMMHTEG